MVRGYDVIDPYGSDNASVAGNAIWAAVMAAGRAVFPHEIKIVSLNSQESLSDPQQLGGGHSLPFEAP